ncbi:hypothetical protein [Lacisediminimonas sp.]|uniref:hypothetical protein n=1 Tax=Lacisediminimonas sp. TaxID=3060582 RepID=UPI002722FBC0|nr:hypothetical protein [Lacisediminimonas sp.]MDO8299555.1 hypothetical protein [Lacisediminimonas sp.]
MLANAAQAQPAAALPSTSPVATQSQKQQVQQEQPAPVPPAAPPTTQAASAPTEPATIAYRQQTTGIVEQTLNSVLLTLGLLVLTGAGLLAMRKRLRQKLTLAAVAGPSLRVKERLRLNPRLTVYVLHVRNREILLAQSGDTLITLGDPTPTDDADNVQPT